jgi:outer membrane protein assembly factor BamB
MNRFSPFLVVALVFYAELGVTRLWAADQPQWGQAWTRNLVSPECGLPETFDRHSGQHMKWTARLGTETHGTPIIAGGRVYIGTNNGEPRDPKHKGDRGVLMCLDEQSGELLWQLVVPKRVEDIFFDWPNSGLCSPPTVEGDRVYVVNNRGEVLCLDAHGMANGNDGPFKDEGRQMTVKDNEWKIPEGEPILEPGAIDADIIWLFDLTTGAGVYCHDGTHSSILIDGDYLYLNTGTGVDNTHKAIRKPDAPSLIVLDKRTGRLLARENEKISPNIFHSTWSPPSLAEVNGRRLIFFNGGNGIIYAFAALEPGLAEKNDAGPASLAKVWQFDFDPAAPKTNVHRFNGNRRESPSNFFGMPVFHQNRIYAAGGGDIWWGKNQAWLKCIDATKTGDLTGDGLVWEYKLNRHVLATPAVFGGMVFIADIGRTFHCVDAQTGEPLWTHDIRGDAWGSPLVADGKVYLGTRAGQFLVFAASREKQVLSTLELVSPISATPTAANGVLYVATMTHLYALSTSKLAQ